MRIVRADASGGLCEGEGGCPADVLAPLSMSFELAVRRARADGFVSGENEAGIVDFAEPAGAQAGPAGMSDDEIVTTFVREVGSIWGQSGVHAEAAGEDGYVEMRLAPFQDEPESWHGEVELWESLLETFGLLLLPGALRGTARPGSFFACPLGKSEEALLTGIDRLQTQLTQRKFLYGRW